MNDEYLKNAIIQFVVSRFKEDVRKALGISFAGIKLHWDEGFEQFLKEHKKRRKVMPREVARFIQSRFGELKTSEARYEDLLSEADNYYPKYLEKLRELVYSSHMQENES